MTRSEERCVRQPCQGFVFKEQRERPGLLGGQFCRNQLDRGTVLQVTLQLPTDKLAATIRKDRSKNVGLDNDVLRLGIADNGPKSRIAVNATTSRVLLSIRGWASSLGAPTAEQQV